MRVLVLGGCGLIGAAIVRRLGVDGLSAVGHGRSLVRAAAAADEALPTTYRRLYRAWLLCAFPAFAGVLAIVWLMAAKPAQ